MATYGASIIGRNDDYGLNLLERATYCLNSMLMFLDEVIYVDWNTDIDKPTLVEEIKNDLVYKEKLKYIRIYPDQAKEWTKENPNAQAVVEVMARNIGLRRLESDFLVSSNIDTICPNRNYIISSFTDTNTFWTTGMRAISLYKLRELGDRRHPHIYMPALEQLLPHYPQQPIISVHRNDSFSLVSNCGDFQIGYKDVVYKIRGFEESLTGRGYADSNIQMKAALAGYNIKVAWNVPVWHIGHEGGMGGTGGMNNPDDAFNLQHTTNPETWGFSEEELELHRL